MKNHTKRKPTARPQAGRNTRVGVVVVVVKKPTHTSRNEPATGSQMMAAAVGEKHEVVEVEVES